MSTDRAPAVEQEVPTSHPAADVPPGQLPESTGQPPAAGQQSAAHTEPPGDAHEPQPARRKLRLNPTIDPSVVRPIPNLVGATETPPVAAPVPSAPPIAEHKPAPAPVADAKTAPSSEPPAEAASVEPVAPPPPVRRGPPVEIPRGESLDAEMEAEIAAAMQTGETPVVPILEVTPGDETPPEVDPLKTGAKLHGTVQSVSADSVFLDLGLRFTGVVPLRQFDPAKPPQVGDKTNVVVSKVDESEGLVHCNLPRGRSRISGDWSAIAVGQVIDCMVSKTNKGGLEVSVGNLRGFLPASQVDLGFVANLESFVGQKIAAKVTEVNPARRRLVVSRRVLLTEERQAGEQKAFEELQPGLTRTGTVKTIKDYGAFVDIGGVDGFLHIGQISWQRIKHPSDVLQEGQTVEVKILSIDKEKKRISLGMRQMEQNPWAIVESKYAKGSHISGKVTRIEPFGAFVELEPGIEGLVHISELDHKRVARVGEVLTVGQTVELQVMEVEPKRKRIALSLKALKAKPEVPKDEDLSPGKGQIYERKHKGNLKGGIGGAKHGGLFGDPRQFS
jgi:predicted RNA-binding protein with RPS1 domain